MEYSVSSPRDLCATLGPCIVEAAADDFWGGEESKSYRSRIIYNPTWGELFRIAVRQQKRTRDFHHDFFESARIIRRIPQPNGTEVKVLELVLGS